MPPIEREPRGPRRGLHRIRRRGRDDLIDPRNGRPRQHALLLRGPDHQFRALQLPGPATAIPPPVGPRMQSQIAYTWSHSIDNDSSDSFLTWTAPGFSDRGSSDFDTRHSLTASATYEFPRSRQIALPPALVARAGVIDSIFHAAFRLPHLRPRERTICRHHADERLPAEPELRSSAVAGGLPS